MPFTSCTVLIVDDSPEDQELYRRYLQGANDYLAKPVKLKHLLEIITQQLSKTDN